MKKMGISDTQVGYVGDDIMDIPLLLRAGLSVTVPDGVSEVKKVVDYVTKKKGGEGAVREVCDLILKAQNKWSIIISGL
ncbi:MAG: HAD hydrolase family protein [Thermodesulfobacteriota bacterium]|nr:HAD hydrolase family protein [Thermodesulfobacteriota bacterium]